jgi:hypothetical protein
VITRGAEDSCTIDGASVVITIAAVAKSLIFFIVFLLKLVCENYIKKTGRASALARIEINTEDWAMRFAKLARNIFYMVKIFVC